MARDIAVPGDSFRIMGKRAVPTYVARSGTPTKGVVFYFGYVNGDPARRGWVMANCLK